MSGDLNEKERNSLAKTQGERIPGRAGSREETMVLAGSRAERKLVIPQCVGRLVEVRSVRSY